MKRKRRVFGRRRPMIAGHEYVVEMHAHYLRMRKKRARSWQHNAALAAYEAKRKEAGL